VQKGIPKVSFREQVAIERLQGRPADLQPDACLVEITELRRRRGRLCLQGGCSRPKHKEEACKALFAGIKSDLPHGGDTDKPKVVHEMAHMNGHNVAGKVEELRVVFGRHPHRGASYQSCPILQDGAAFQKSLFAEKTLCECA
jgi:hypothetical protein